MILKGGKVDNLTLDIFCPVFSLEQINDNEKVVENLTIVIEENR